MKMPRLRLPRITTPRPGHVLIAALLVAVIAPGSIVVIDWFIRSVNGVRAGFDETRQFGIAVLHIAGPGVVVGWPIAALVRWLARHSVIVNALGFAAFAAIAPGYELSRYPTLDLWEALAIAFAIYGAVSLGLALLIGWFRRRPPPPDIAKLGDMFG